MDIIFEFLFSIFWLLFQAGLEMLGEAILEVGAEIGLRSLTEPFRRSKPINPIFAGIGYLLYGAMAGGLSLLLPKILVVSWWLRVLNLVVTPVVCGLIMDKMGHLRERRGDRPIRLNTFLYGYLFALAMAIVRLIWR